MNTINTMDTDYLSVSRNVNVGNDATVQGSVRIGHDLRVEGMLDAPNMKTVVKGVYPTRQALVDAYPHPKTGWIAGVGTSLPCPAYNVEDGEWSADPCGQIELNLSLDGIQAEISAEADARLEADDALQQAINRLDSEKASKAELSAEQRERQSVETGLGNSIASLDSTKASKAEMSTAIGAEQMARQQADTALGGLITDEVTARSEADTELGNNITVLNAKLPTIDLSEIDIQIAPCMIGSVITVNSNTKPVGHILCSYCSNGNTLQQTFVTYLPLDSDNQIKTDHFDNGDMHIYTRIYCMIPNEITVAETGEVVRKNHWSAWSEISIGGIRAELDAKVPKSMIEQSLSEDPDKIPSSAAVSYAVGNKLNASYLEHSLSNSQSKVPSSKAVSAALGELSERISLATIIYVESEEMLEQMQQQGLLIEGQLYGILED